MTCPVESEHYILKYTVDYICCSHVNCKGGLYIYLFILRWMMKYLLKTYDTSNFLVRSRNSIYNFSSLYFPSLSMCIFSKTFSYLSPPSLYYTQCSDQRRHHQREKLVYCLCKICIKKSLMQIGLQ